MKNIIPFFKTKIYLEYYPLSDKYFIRIGKNLYLTENFNTGLIRTVLDIDFATSYSRKEDAEKTINKYKELKNKTNVKITKY